MSKQDISKLLKQRMAATQQASELQVGDEAYKTLFHSSSTSQTRICELPIDRLRPFFTADIGFKPYPSEKLTAFAEQLSIEGLFERIIVRPIPGSGNYEIIAGHNRTEAARLLGWQTISAEVVGADDERATTIAIATNLLRRQDLSVIERGKAYKALLDAQKKQGFRSDIETSGENRQKFLTRELVADFFGVTEYEIRKAIKLTQLIPELQCILENTPKQLNLACAEIMADYDAETQTAFIEMCSIEGYQINKATMKQIAVKCPAPTAEMQMIFAAWREARAEAEQRAAKPSKKISFDRRKFAPYLDKLGSDAELEALFLEFLRNKVG